MTIRFKYYPENADFHAFVIMFNIGMNCYCIHEYDFINDKNYWELKYNAFI